MKKDSVGLSLSVCELWKTLYRPMKIDGNRGGNERSRMPRLSASMPMESRLRVIIPRLDDAWPWAGVP